jgi:hypothetical protein
VRKSAPSLTWIAALLLVLAIPTMGASCIALWAFAERECRATSAAGVSPSHGDRVLRDIGIAGSIVFAACAGSIAFHWFLTRSP